MVYSESHESPGLIEFDGRGVPGTDYRTVTRYISIVDEPCPGIKSISSFFPPLPLSLDVHASTVRVRASMIWFEITVIISDLHDILSSRELCTYVSDIGLKIIRSFYLDLPVDLQFFFTVSCIKVNLSRFWVMLDIIMGNGESRRKLRETRQERKYINLCCTTSIIIRIILNSTSGRILRKEMQKDPQGTWRYGGNSHRMALVSRPPFN